MLAILNVPAIMRRISWSAIVFKLAIAALALFPIAYTVDLIFFLSGQTPGSGWKGSDLGFQLYNGAFLFIAYAGVTVLVAFVFWIWMKMPDITDHWEDPDD